MTTAALNETRARVLCVIEENPGLTNREIAFLTGLLERTCQRVILCLVRSEEIHGNTALRRPGDSRHTPKRYYFGPDPELVRARTFVIPKHEPLLAQFFGLNDPERYVVRMYWGDPGEALP